jgi:hypothetical protein
MTITEAHYIEEEEEEEEQTKKKTVLTAPAKSNTK